MLREKTTEVNRLTDDFDNASDEIQSLSMRKPGTPQQQYEHENLIHQLTDKKEELENRICELDIVLREKSREVDRLTDDLDNARDEVKALRMRLSKLTVYKLRDNYPIITDLSDQNRPTELGKRYSEIYDHQWSDAFEHLPGKNEDQKVKILYAVMEGAFEYCQKMTKSQITDVRDNLLGQAAMKYAAYELSNLLQGFGLKNKKGEVLIQDAKKCVEVCWYMAVCDPPMAIYQVDVMKPLDVNIYKPYTRSTKDMKNQVVELNVWPALYLNLNGPLVDKGVTQPKDAKVKQ